MENRKLQVWLPLLFSVIMVAGMVIGYKLREESGIKNFFTINNKTSFQEVLDLVSLKYVDQVATDSLSNNAINDVLHHLDPHSVFIPASDLDYVNDDLRGNFSGIGVEFQMFYDTVNVLNVLPDGPSERAGLQVGDKFLKVNDSISIAGKHLQPNDIRRLLRGENGSIVKLTVMRDRQIIPFNVSRGTIPVPSVDASYMITPSTGFIHINKFAESTYREFMRSLENLQAQHMQKLILDLRGNGGGLLGVAVNIADEFLDGNKLIVYTKGSHVPKYEYKCKRDGLFETGDLVLLVDEGSASASEVLTGALQDWDRATIVGRRTFGKGLVQEQFQLTDGSALRLTVARYYSPLGRNIQKSYKQGYEKYEEEVMNRFHDGEVLKGDTTKKSGPAFKTPKGRIVYGGGGITPDIYVPFDTASMGNEVMKLYLKGTLSNFIYTYFIEHKEQFNQYKKAADIVAFKAGEDEWNALKKFAVRDSIDLNKVSEKDKSLIIKRIPSLVARQIWRYEGYYEVMNRSDDFVQKALQVLNEKDIQK
ncbi:S41 family peptidase [Segetibacter koreensis]|uniref:S41 family peptidase n=1 Tax=Segetibacter koreensis TaxID=398037 RepID=UPI0003749ED0|nr:S41 family peptidase [Segetibacter koreensis]